MTTLTINLYTIEELKELNPEGYEAAFEHYKEHQCFEIPWQHETIQSLKEIVKDAGIELRDWNLGAYNRNNGIELRFYNASGTSDNHDEISEMSGKRAFAWLENNLLCKYRIPFISMMGSKKRRNFAGYQTRKFYAPGLVAPCPATGYCSDDEYLESLQTSLRKGWTLKESFENLADVCQTILERDSEDQRSEDYFLNECSAHEWQFGETGELFQ